MDLRDLRNVRVVVCHLWRFAQPARGCSNPRCALYHRRLLVHILHQLCKSCRYDRARVYRHLRRHQSSAHRDVHPRAIHRVTCRFATFSRPVPRSRPGLRPETGNNHFLIQSCSPVRRATWRGDKMQTDWLDNRPELLARLHADFPQLSGTPEPHTLTDLAATLANRCDLTDAEARETLQDWLWINRPKTSGTLAA